MFGISDLKKTVDYREEQTPCPVLGCERWVERQRKKFQRDHRFHCDVHRIYISRSTFEYADVLHNLLGPSEDDLSLLRTIRSVKRESRMARDNSEDAVTWNVVRLLERTGRLGEWLTHVTGLPAGNPRVIYWSLCQDAETTWPPLEEARTAFGEEERRGSEPDVIVDTVSVLFFVEAKLTASNDTKPSDPSRGARYTSGADGWFKNVVTSDFDSLANKQKRYELLRLWLLGTWIAAKRGKAFCLVNLVRDPCERTIVESMSRHLKICEERQLKRAAWEEIYRLIATSAEQSADDNRLLNYMREKSIGYNSDGVLRAAFALT